MFHNKLWSWVECSPRSCHLCLLSCMQVLLYPPWRWLRCWSLYQRLPRKHNTQTPPPLQAMVVVILVGESKSVGNGWTRTASKNTWSGEREGGNVYRATIVFYIITVVVVCHLRLYLLLDVTVVLFLSIFFLLPLEIWNRLRLFLSIFFDMMV